MKITFFIVFFGLLIQSAFSSEPMGWEQCVQYALENSYEIREQKLNVDNQQLSVNSAYYNYLPGVYGYSNYNKNYGRSIDPQTNAIANSDYFDANYGLNGSLGLFEGFTRINKVKYEKYIHEYNKSSLEASRVNITFTVIDNYIKVLFFTGISEIALEQINISNRLLHKQKEMLRLGRISETDINETEAQLALDSLSYIRYDMNKQTSVNSLKQVMNFPVSDTLLLAENTTNTGIISDTDYTFKNIMVQAEEHLPEINMLKNRLNATNARLAEAKGSILPTLTLNSNWGSAYYQTTRDSLGNTLGFGNQFDGNQSTRISLNLYIPIFNRLHNRTNIQKAKIDKDLAENYYEKEYSKIQYGIHENALLLESAIKQYQSAMKSEEKQLTAFKAGEKKLETGLINTIDFYTLKNEYARSKAERLRAGMEMFLQYKTVQYYLTGTIL